MSGPRITGDSQGEAVAVGILLGQSCGVVGCFFWLLLLLAVQNPHLVLQSSHSFYKLPVNL